MRRHGYFDIGVEFGLIFWLGVTHLPLAYSAFKMLRSRETPRSVWVWGLGGGFVTLLIFVYFSAVTFPHHGVSNEGSAISSMRNIVSSQITYQATTGKGSSAPDLATLYSSKLIDSVLGSGTKNGYVFSVSGEDSTFTITGRPLVYGETGTRSFFADESGVIRNAVTNRPASAGDVPMGKDPEHCVLESLRLIVASQINYRATMGNGSYATSLDQLESAEMIDDLLASGTKCGYRIELRPGSDTSTSGLISFSLSARPLQQLPDYYVRSFLVDGTGLIYNTEENRPATSADPPLGPSMSLIGIINAGSAAGVQVLLEEGADPNQKTKALTAAVQRGRTDIVKILLSAGAEMNYDILVIASIVGDPTLIQLLLDEGADINASDIKGRTALAVAREIGHTEAFELLTRHSESLSASPDSEAEAASPVVPGAYRQTSACVVSSVEVSTSLVGQQQNSRFFTLRNPLSLVQNSSSIRWCVVKVDVSESGNFEISVSWQMTGSPEAWAKKAPDPGNQNMYVVDNRGRRYDHTATQGGAQTGGVLKTGEVLNGVFVFPSVQPGTSHLSFHDADQGIVIRDISLSRDTR